MYCFGGMLPIPGSVPQNKRVGIFQYMRIPPHLCTWLFLVGSIKLQVSFAKEPYKSQYSAKETYNLIDPTNRSHPISLLTFAAQEMTRQNKVVSFLLTRENPTTPKNFLIFAYLQKCVLIFAYLYICKIDWFFAYPYVLMMINHWGIHLHFLYSTASRQRK